MKTLRKIGKRLARKSFWKGWKRSFLGKISLLSLSPSTLILRDQLSHRVNQYLQENELKVSRGPIVDASIISSPSSNKTKERDPEMHQTRKRNQWYFGIKAYIGVDSRTKLIHSVVATSANVHDRQILPALLYGDQTRVWGDSAYTGQKQVIGERVPRAKDFTNAKGYRNRKLTEEDLAKNKNESSVRTKVECQFGIIKRQFGFSKVRYRGLDKNAHRLFVTCALSNLVVAKRVLLRRTRLNMQASCA
jgi:IS5 family transposase